MEDLNIVYSNGAQEITIDVTSEFSWLEAFESMAGEYSPSHGILAKKVSAKFAGLIKQNQEIVQMSKRLDEMENSFIKQGLDILALKKDNTQYHKKNMELGVKLDKIKSLVDSADFFAKLSRFYKEIKELI